MIYVTGQSSGVTIKRQPFKQGSLYCKGNSFVLFRKMFASQLAMSHECDGQSYAIPEICQAGLKQSTVV